MTRAPRTDRLFVAERYGKIFSFSDNPEASEAALFLDLGKVLSRLQEPLIKLNSGRCLHAPVDDIGSEKLPPKNADPE